MCWEEKLCVVFTSVFIIICYLGCNLGLIITTDSLIEWVWNLVAGGDLVL